MHWEILAQDVRYSARALRRTPAFTLAAVLAMALGIGAGTAVFSVVDRILFRALPYPGDSRLISLGMTAPIAPQEFLLGYDYLDWSAASTRLESPLESPVESPIESMGVWSGVSDCDLTDANPVRLLCGTVDSHLLPTPGIQPVLGRNFTSDEDRPNVPKTALISYSLWRSRFAGDAGVVGKPVSLDGQPVTITGVLPPQFELPTLARADLLIPQALDVPAVMSRRVQSLLYAVGRLKPGATIEQARAALVPLFDSSMKDVPPSFRKDVGLRLRPLRDLQIHDSRLASWILLAAVLAVLLIACANVANLLLARAAGRAGPSMADILKMVHPKPADSRRANFYGYMLGRPFNSAALPPLVIDFERFKTGEELDPPDVPFTMLSALPLGQKDWAAIARHASWQTVRMNLNTFARHGVFEEAGMTEHIASQLRDAAEIARARVFPYQLMSAYQNCGAGVPSNIREALQDAMDIAIANVPAIDGAVVVCPDVSGSMSSPVTGVRRGATTSYGRFAIRMRALVGRTPWSAADALVGPKSGSRGTRADEGVRPTQVKPA